MTGLLSVVATPIGNLEDVTLRALRVLREADAILAEDTRHTRTLCAKHAVSTRLVAFHAHSSPGAVEALAQELARGARYALVTDAGTPVVSDPGAALVARAAALGVKVEPVPGPSAALAAVSACGLRIEGFRFVGFLPRAGGKRTAALEAAARDALATVLFEAPGRVAETLTDLAAACGAERHAALCRELTKAHEEIARGTLGELAARFAGGTRGEVTLVVEGRGRAAATAPDDAAIDAAARDALAEGLSARDAAARVAEAAGLSKREVYRRVIALLGREKAASPGAAGDGTGDRPSDRS